MCMLLLDWILLFPSVVVGHSRLTKDSRANTVKEELIQSKRARDSDNHRCICLVFLFHGNGSKVQVG